MDFVADCIERARSGDLEEAFHGLRELGPEALFTMQRAYRCENDPIVRSVIVAAIWQHRQLSLIQFLAGVLRDPAPVVWKEALDGLVALASPESIRVLRSAAADGDLVRRAWIEEAIEQVADGITPQESADECMK